MSNISKTDLLDLSKAAVGDRGRNYGSPEDNFNRIALRWKAHIHNRFGVHIPIDAVSVAIMCSDLKLARLENQPNHLDSWTDLAGYAACGANIVCPDPNINTTKPGPISDTVSQKQAVSDGLTYGLRAPGDKFMISGGHEAWRDQIVSE